MARETMNTSARSAVVYSPVSAIRTSSRCCLAGTTEPPGDIAPVIQWLESATIPMAELAEPDFERLFNGSPVRRAGFLGFERNLAIAMGNSGLARYTLKLREWAEAADDGLRTAARWALGKLSL